MRRHRREKGVEYAPLRPGWVGGGVFTGTFCISDEQLWRLYRFFVVETPCPNLSSSGISLTERGWGAKPWQTKGNRLAGRLLSDLGFNTNESVFIATSVNETKALFTEAQLSSYFKRECIEERIAFYQQDSAQFISIARHIRNSLAHGRFAAARKLDDGIYLYFEDGVRAGERFAVRSRMVLKLETLERWMSIIKKEEF